VSELKAPKPSPYDAPELYDILFDTLDFDIPFWTEVARQAGGPVLEAGCGTGRILLRLIEAGLDADGFDSSAPMIERLQAKARAAGRRARAVVADMREFSLPRRYARVICAFNGFAHCETTEDQVRALGRFREHLEPGGAAVLHMSYPGPKYWAEPDGVPVLETETRVPSSGHTLQLWDTRFKDPVAQLQRSEIEMREVGASRRTAASHRFATSQRWVYRFELELLFRAAGFARWAISGGFDGKPLTSPEDQMIAWAWRD
jgi:SAM-dependent methyltransferase